MNPDLFISKDASIKDALNQLSTSGMRCLLVVEKGNFLLGTITDGDIRRAILKKTDIRLKIDKFFNSDPIYLKKGEYKQKELENLIFKERIDLVPIVNSKNIVVGIKSIEDFSSQSYSNGQNKDLEKVPLVIMAGGKGTRLEPFTQVLPKPLMPIQGKPIIDHIIEKFKKYGVNTVFLSVNFKSRILKAYFEESESDLNFKFLEESKPLGTAGSLKLLDKNIKEQIIITNCDVIVDLDYSDLYQFHNKGNYDITLVASANEFTLPYGVCVLNEEGSLDLIQEKPKFDFLVNTGVYVIKPEVISLIPKDKFFDFTDLVEKVKDEGKKIGVYPVDDELFTDIGQWVEYQDATRKLNQKL